MLGIQKYSVSRSATTLRTPLTARQQFSVAVSVARVLCIVGIVYSHAWTGLVKDDILALNNTAQGIFRWSLVQLFGLSSVPLLGVISGWFVESSLVKKGASLFLRDKVKIILAPMVLWNIVVLSVVCGSAYFFGLRAPLPSSVHWVINEIFSVYAPSEINVQMPFMRDLFICMILALVLTKLPDWGLLCVLALSFFWSVLDVHLFVLLRPPILVFFTIGILARRHFDVTRTDELPIVSIGVAYLAFTAVQIWYDVHDTQLFLNSPYSPNLLDLLDRLLAAVFIWCLSWRLAAGRYASTILRLEPYIFVLFCSHLLMTWLGDPLFMRVVGPLGSPAYPVFLILQPFIALVMAVGIGKVLQRVWPGAASMLSGGRLTQRPRGEVVGVTSS